MRRPCSWKRKARRWIGWPPISRGTSCPPSWRRSNLPLVTAAALRKDIASGSTAPVYVLFGHDEIEKAEVAAQFLEIVDEGLQVFNVDRFYGGDVSAARIIDRANTHPMMVPRRVIVVLEAEKLLVPKRESKASEEDQERLTEFIKAPAPDSTVVFVCGGLDKRRTLVKLLLKQAQVVDCGTIESAEDAERWLKNRAARERVTFEPAAARALVERAGQDIVRLRGAFERVVLYALGQATITVDDVRQSVPAGPESQIDFGIANAIRENDAAQALSQLAAALDGGVVPVMVLGQLRVAAERLPKPRVRAAVDALFRTDLALKSSGGDPRILLERLVVELCAEAPRKGAPYERRGYSA